MPSVYREFKDHGNNPIGAARATILRDDYSGEEILPKIEKRIEQNKAKSLFIACAYGGDKTAWELVEILHESETAWAKNYNGSRDKVIPDEDILQEFEKHMDEIATFILG